MEAGLMRPCVMSAKPNAMMHPAREERAHIAGEVWALQRVIFGATCAVGVDLAESLLVAAEPGQCTRNRVALTCPI